MSKGKSATVKQVAQRKSQGSVKGNFPAKKEYVSVFVKGAGHKSVAVGKLSNFPPAQTGNKEEDVAAMRKYREAYRAEMRRVNTAKVAKPATLFDLYKLNGGKAKHPMQLAKDVCSAINYSSNSDKELRVV